jgi:septum formation topological specificity factor MinE
MGAHLMAGRHEFMSERRLNARDAVDRAKLRQLVAQRRREHTSFPPSLVDELLDIIDSYEGVDSHDDQAVIEDSPLERIADALETLVERSAGAGDGIAGQAPRPPTG